jgi:hypothetical protein
MVVKCKAKGNISKRSLETFVTYNMENICKKRL